MLQETSRLRNRSTALSETLSSVEVELRSCRDALERALVDRDELQRQEACHSAEIDRLRQVNVASTSTTSSKLQFNLFLRLLFLRIFHHQTVHVSSNKDTCYYLYE